MRILITHCSEHSMLRQGRRVLNADTHHMVGYTSSKVSASRLPSEMHQTERRNTQTKTPYDATKTEHVSQKHHYIFEQLIQVPSWQWLNAVLSSTTFTSTKI